MTPNHRGQTVDTGHITAGQTVDNHRGQTVDNADTHHRGRGRVGLYTHVPRVHRSTGGQQP